MAKKGLAPSKNLFYGGSPNVAEVAESQSGPIDRPDAIIENLYECAYDYERDTRKKERRGCQVQH